MEGLYDKILVCLDDGDHAQAVLDAAVKMAQAANAQLRVVSALPFVGDADITYGMMDGGMVAPYVAMESATIDVEIKARQSKIEKLVKELSTKHLRAVEVIVEFGEPKSMIMEQYTDFTGVLIVLGATSKKTLERLLVGSVAQYIVNHAPCDVLVIK